ncbi:NAD(P)/FAD-dependent oxidoreductase [Serinicoccus sp. LYQ131]|uniref:NAD(P)/FAD-dependent oxidoreductase n=1 Tax=Serinicoccus sp. LYQ131 TaxID=3378797 RepID=UPI003854655B
MPERADASHDVTSRGVVSHDVLVVGGGNGGVSAAGRVRRLGCRDVAVLEPRSMHRYRPLLNYVGGGQARRDELTLTMSQALSTGVTHHLGAAVAVDPGARIVTTDTGRRLGYRDLVLAPGLRPDLAATPGLEAALHAGWATHTFTPDTATRLWPLVRATRSGTVVFTVPPEPAPCGGSALKPLFLACDHWRREGVLDAIRVVLAVPTPTVLGLPFVDRRLQPYLDRYGVELHTSSTLAEVDTATRSVTLDGPTGSTRIDDVTMAHLVPVHRPDPWLAESGLAQPGTGLVDVDPGTLRHSRFDDVWGIGDAAALQTRPSGGALRTQVKVLGDNIVAARLGRPLGAYDGYTVVPVTVEARSALIAEFDRAGRPTGSLPLVDLTRPNPFVWFFDRYLEPQVYRHRLLKGSV